MAEKLKQSPNISEKSIEKSNFQIIPINVVNENKDATSVANLGNKHDSVL